MLAATSRPRATGSSDLCRTRRKRRCLGPRTQSKAEWVDLSFCANESHCVKTLTSTYQCQMQSIRAGTIDVSGGQAYRFSLPPSWKEGKVANIQSGNFCQVGSWHRSLHQMGRTSRTCNDPQPSTGCCTS